jgi:predicted deacylase
LIELEWGRIALPEGVAVRGGALRTGSGSPRTVVITGLHGDETTGTYVLRHLVEGDLGELPGTVDFVTMPNWLGTLLDRRDVPLDGSNLNRLFGQSPDEGPAARIAAALLAFIGEADLVIDLHNWESPTCVLGISYRTPDPATRAGRALANLGCDFIWLADGGSFRDTLGHRLTQMGIENAAIEYPPAWLIRPGDVARWSAQLRRALIDAGPPPALPPCGKRRAVVTPSAGLLDPLAEPGTRLTAGDTFARILGVSTLAVECSLAAPGDGILLHVENRRFLHCGDVVAFLGVEAK